MVKSTLALVILILSIQFSLAQETVLYKEIDSTKLFSGNILSREY